jgi:hypothetical protein
MLTCPKIGQQVRLHYNRRLASSGIVPHGRHGVVVARKTRGKSRNHLVQLDCGRLVIVPCGNLLASG